ncbi:hypothetical protein IT575_03530 [bacterium]|nr:hypothetical protein [bacterium]
MRTSHFTLILTLATVCLLLAPRAASAAEIVEWTPGKHSEKDKERAWFDNEHEDDFIWIALEELSGKRPAADASRSELAKATLALLNELPKYGERETKMLRPPVPFFVTEGYLSLGKATLPASRYMKYYTAGEHPEFFTDATALSDTAALYCYFSMYDAEWFGITRIPAYKAWLSCVALSYPPHWQKFKGMGQSALHERLVTPFQTKDEPWREIDNWITAYTRPELDGEPQVFVKPLVRNALVAELLDNAGLDFDPRYLKERAYSNSAPSLPGYDSRRASLLAALTLELSQEIYEQDGNTKQPLWLRDWFLERFNTLK